MPPIKKTVSPISSSIAALILKRSYDRGNKIEIPGRAMELSNEGKEELALALILWKDFKSQGKFDIEIAKQAIEIANHLGVYPQYEKLLSIVPPMKIEPRYP